MRLFGNRKLLAAKDAEIARLTGKVEAFTNGETFLYLRAEDQDKAAMELSDADLVKWVRWALVKASEVYGKRNKCNDRSAAELLTIHAVVNLARLVQDSNATTGTFSVEGASWKGKPDGGDWTVTIQRTPKDTPS